MLHKSAVLLLLITGAVPLLSALVFSIAQMEITSEMSRELSQKELVSISIEDQEIQWVEKDREILIQGQLFDIRSLVSSNGRTTFTGLFDKKETDLTGLLKDQQGNQPSGPDMALMLFFSKLHSLCYHPTAVFLPEVIPAGWPPLCNSSTPPFSFSSAIEQPPRA